MARRVTYRQTGGPEVLEIVDFQLSQPGSGEVLVQQHAAGVNFIDLHLRRGDFSIGPLPAAAGLEGAGTVEEVGAGVVDLKPGDRVAYTGLPGAYAERVVVPAERLVKVPSAVTPDVAAAALMRGVTAERLLAAVPSPQDGDWVLVHAATGGVGSILCQLAKLRGLRVIGVVGSAQKAALALANGCERAVDRHSEDFVERVQEWTAGNGVKTVFDGIGGTVFHRSLNCLGQLGFMINYGITAGPVGPLDIGRLSKGSLGVGHFSFFDHVRSPDTLQRSADIVFGHIAAGDIRIEIGRRYRLEEVSEAHRALENAETSGSTILDFS